MRLPHFQPILPLTHALWTLLRRLCDIRQICAPYSSLPSAGPFGHCHIGRDKLVLSFFIHSGMLLSYMATEMRSLDAGHLR